MKTHDICKYPAASEWLTIGHPIHNLVIVKDEMSGGEHILSTRELELLLRLDGKTDPDVVMEGINDITKRRLMHRFAMLGLLADDMDRGCASTPIGFGKEAKFMNRILLALWLPMLVAGLIFGCDSFEHGLRFGGVWGYTMGVIAGVALHELAHRMATFGVEGRIYGCFFLNYHTDSQEHMSAYGLGRFARVQAYAAGIEANIFLFGLLLLLARLIPYQAGLLTAAAIPQLLFITFELSLHSVSDGMGIMAALLGQSEYLMMLMPRKTVLNSWNRGVLRRQGPIGFAVMLGGVAMLLCEAGGIAWFASILVYALGGN